MGTSVLARLPLGMTGLAIVLLVSRGGSYARAGGVVAVYVTGAGIAGPLLGRGVDRFGRRWVLRPAALAEGALLTVLALLPAGATGALFACALAAGLCTPPVVSSTRSLWPVVVPAGQLQVVYALEATLQELAYIVGPSLVAVVVTLADPAVAVMVGAGVLAVGVFAFSLHPLASMPAGPTAPAEQSGRRGLPLSLPVIAAGLLVVAAFNYVELSTVAFTRGHGAARDAGVVLAVWSAGSLIGGLTFGTRAGSQSRPRRRLAALIAALAGSTLLPVAALNVWMLSVLLLFAGVAIAPTFAALYSLAAAEAPAERQTEAFGWLSTGFQVGSALGSLSAGAVVQASGPRVGYAAAAGVVALGSPALALASRRIAIGSEHPAPAGGGSA
jgi:MFS family permease